MKGHGLVHCYFPLTAQRCCKRVLSFTRKSTHCLLSEVQNFYVIQDVTILLQVTCSRAAITDWGSIIRGWNNDCTTDSTSGTFTVEYIHIGRGLCGLSYDKITVDNCRPRTPCSSFG